MEAVIGQKGLDLLAQRMVEFIDVVSKKAPGFLIENFKNSQLILNKGLPEYAAAHFSKCETVRTLLKRDSPTVLEKIYEPHRFHFSDSEVTESQLHDEIGRGLKRIVVSGSAGSGKSVFLKRLFRSSIESGMTHYPIFFELRNLTLNSKATLLDEIFASIEKFTDGFTRKQFDFGLKKGLFFLMIDALDEAPSDRREAIAAELVEFGQKYWRCPIVVTSRPSESFVSWEGFYEAKLLPFSFAQCVSFISKVEFIEDKKVEFLEFLTEGEFENHRGFLSNPLLASMMLLTYDEYGDIPRRRHIFYEKCFLVLLKEHDSSKGRYRREFCSSLSYEDLQEVFTFFCAFSYWDDSYVFTKDTVNVYIADALKAAGLVAEVDHVCTDLVDSVSILQKDGGVYEFAHRSFQEFFFAKFVIKDREISLPEKISRVKGSLDLDGLVGMIYDMDKGYFERHWLLPMAQGILRDWRSSDPAIAPDRFIGKFFTRVTLRERAKSRDQETGSRLYYTHSVRVSRDEYSAVRSNLLLLEFMGEYGLEDDEIVAGRENSDEDLLSLFGFKEWPKERLHADFQISHHNRHKMVALGSGRFAHVLKVRLEKLAAHIEKTTEQRRVTLADRLLRPEE